MQIFYALSQHWKSSDFEKGKDMLEKFDVTKWLGWITDQKTQ